MNLRDKKNTNSLSNEIQILNDDIEKCEDSLFNKKKYCTPSCCCYCYEKHWTMSPHKNFVCVTRKKSDNNIITKLDIIPRCNNLKETCVTDRAIVDVIVKKSPLKKCELKNRKSNSKYGNCKKVDAATDPISFSSKDKNYRDKTWGVILKGNLSDKRRKSRCCKVQTSIVSTTSSDSDATPLASHCFIKKNVSVQCDDLNNKSDIEISPLESIQIILNKLKTKLKDDTFMRNKLDELEDILSKVFKFNNNSQSIRIVEQNTANGNNASLLTSKEIHSASIVTESENISLLKLDETYRELENSCLKLKKERDSSLQILSEKTAELMESKKREAELRRKFIETDEKIKEFSVKIENYAFSVKNLSDHIEKLQNENKELKNLEKQMSNLNTILRNVIKENKILLTELQQVTVERNKLQLALTLNEQ